jgi:glycosyltransferase involved in cell wall biosynthesis
MKNLFVFSELNPSGLTGAIANKASENSEVYILNITIGPESGFNSNFGYHNFQVSDLSLKSLMLIFIEIVKTILSFKPNLLYSSGRIASMLSMPTGFFCGVKNRIFTRHHSIENHMNGHWREMFFDKLVCLFSTKVVAVSKIVQKFLLEEGVPNKKIVVIENGIDIEKFSNVRKFSKIIDSEQDIVVIGMLARNVKWKGIEYGIAAFKLFLVDFPKAILIIAGAPNKDELDIGKYLSDVNPGSYKLIVENIESVDFFSEIDIFMHLPISLESEAFGLVYLEALASGVPSVFTKSGVMAELENVSGFHFVNYCDGLETYNALRKIASSGLAVCSISSLLKFNIDVMTESYIRLFNNALNPNRIEN